MGKVASSKVQRLPGSERREARPEGSPGRSPGKRWRETTSAGGAAQFRDAGVEPKTISMIDQECFRDRNALPRFLGVRCRASGALNSYTSTHGWRRGLPCGRALRR